MFQAVPLSIIRSSLTAHLALVYVIRFEVSLRAGPGFHPGPARRLTSLYSYRTPDDGQRNCPKHVEVHFFSENKFGKLVRLLVLL